MSAPASDPAGSPIWLALLVAAGILAVCINLGTLHEGQFADSLLLSLISTQHWTPFYWFQDRYGMLVPLLAMPVRSPLANLLLQGWIMTTAALLAPFLAARCLLGRAGAWLAAGALASLLLLLAASPFLEFEWLACQPYALALALGFAALVVNEGGSLAGRAVALLLTLLAHWVNVSAVVALAPALLLRGGKIADWIVLGLGVAGGVAISSLFAAAPPTTTALIPLAEWPQAWLTLLLSVWAWLEHVWLLGLALAGTVVTAIVVARQGRAMQLRAAAAALAGALVHGLAVGASEWVRLNLYFPRYVLPSLLLLAVAAAIALTAPLRRRSGSIALVGGVALYTLAFLSYGAPSLEGVKASLDRRLGKMTPEIVRSGASVIVGDYWTVWPAVFHANLTLHGSGAEQVLGFTYRSAATNARWLGRSGPILMAAAPGDPAAAELAASVELQLDLVEHGTAIDLFRAVPRAPDAATPP